MRFCWSIPSVSMRNVEDFDSRVHSVPLQPGRKVQGNTMKCQRHVFPVKQRQLQCLQHSDVFRCFTPLRRSLVLAAWLSRKMASTQSSYEANSYRMGVAALRGLVFSASRSTYLPETVSKVCSPLWAPNAHNQWPISGQYCTCTRVFTALPANGYRRCR